MLYLAFLPVVSALNFNFFPLSRGKSLQGSVMDNDEYFVNTQRLAENLETLLLNLRSKREYQGKLRLACIKSELI